MKMATREKSKQQEYKIMTNKSNYDKVNKPFVSIHLGNILLLF